NIPDYDKTAWANGAIKDVTVTTVFNDDTAKNKKVNFTLPDGMRFVSIPVPSNYTATDGVDTGVLSYLNTGDPLGSAISSVSVPSKESTYGKATFGTVSYNLEPGTEKVSFNVSVRVDAAKYYGPTDIKSPIKVETFVGDESSAVDSAQQSIRAEGRNVVGAAEQSSVETMFRTWYTSATLPSVTASTDTEDSFNYTKPYSVVNSIVQEDERGSKAFVPKHVTV
ncbi:cell surface protein, partial [Listeria innocua]|nr:cell surface protein [Listeria innocua]